MTGKAPKGWEVARLDKLADISSGVTKGRKLGSAETVTLPYLSVANVQHGFLDLTEVKSIEVKVDEVERYRLQRDDVVLTEGGDPDKLGRGTLWRDEIPVCLHQNHIFRVRCDDIRLLPAYFAAYLLSLEARTYFLRSAKQTTGIASINMTQLRGLPVRFPDTAKQARIVATLAKADSLRAQRERSLALLDDLLRSAFVEMFGDPASNPKSYTRMPLGHLLAVPPRIGTTRPASDEGDVPVIRVGEIGGDDIPLARCGRVTVSDSEYQRYRCHPGDLLLARAIGSADHLGKATVFPCSSERVVFDSHVMRLRTNTERLLGAFLLHWLRSTGGRSLFLQQGGRTAVQFNINAKQIAGLPINLPPIDHQRRYAALVERVGSQRRLVLKSQREASSLTSTLLHRAFRGEL